MINSALKAASLDTLLTNDCKIYVADKVKIYKPSLRIYRGLVREVKGSFAVKIPNTVSGNTDVWLVSG